MPLVVFVTAYDSYAIKAFDSHALDYVLKPVDEQRLAEAIEKAREYLSLQTEEDQKKKLAHLVAEFIGDDCEEVLRRLAEGEELVTESAYPDVMAIKDGSEITRVRVDTIQWIDAAGDYMCVHTDTDTHIMRRTMKELIEELDPKKFIRVHPRSSAELRCWVSLPTVHSVIRPTSGISASPNSLEPAPVNPARLRAVSRTAICMPKQIPK